VHPVAEGNGAPIADRGTRCASFGTVPRHWIWTQVVIMLFLLASVVIAITRLA
jgi:hypothetical protein